MPLAVRDNLPKIEAFVKSLEKNYDKKIENFDYIRFYALSLFAVVAVSIVFFVKKSLILPVKNSRRRPLKSKKGLQRKT